MASSWPVFARSSQKQPYDFSEIRRASFFEDTIYRSVLQNLKTLLSTLIYSFKPFLILKFLSQVSQFPTISRGSLKHKWVKRLNLPGKKEATILFLPVNLYNAEATIVQSTKTQKFLKTTQTLSYWYSFDSSHWALLDEYPFVRVSVILQDFCIILCWQN